MLQRVSVQGFANKVYRTRAGIMVPLFDAFVAKHRNVLAVLGTPRGSILIPASNIVTDAGDVYYAQRGAAETPTNAFGILELGSAGTPGKTANRSSFTPIASTQKAHDTGYPKTDDADADNTGAGPDIVTYRTSYSKTDFSATVISHGWITNASPGASEPLLTGYAFAAAFDKTADDSLKCFTNHQLEGI